MDQYCLPFCMCSFQPQISHPPTQIPVNQWSGPATAQAQSVYLPPSALPARFEMPPADSTTSEGSITKSTLEVSPKTSAFWRWKSQSQPQSQPKKDTLEELKVNKAEENETKMTMYSMRKDVISKTIFRSIRKYFINDFKAFYDFTKCQKSHNSETSGEFITKIRQYLCSKLTHNCDVQELSVLLLWVIDTKQRYCSVSQQSLDKNKTIISLLYSYNKKKLLELQGSKEFLTLVLHFIEQPDIVSSIIKKRKQTKLVKQYKKTLSALQLQWRQALKA